MIISLRKLENTKFFIPVVKQTIQGSVLKSHGFSAQQFIFLHSIENDFHVFTMMVEKCYELFLVFGKKSLHITFKIYLYLNEIF